VGRRAVRQRLVRRLVPERRRPAARRAWATDDKGLLVGPALGYPVYVSASTIAYMEILSRHDVAEVNGDG
jgi:hypothetical protein